MVALNEKPEERSLRADMRSGRFRLGLANGMWGFAPDHDAESAVQWPYLHIWVAAPPRENSPDKYYYRFDIQEYPIRPLTGTFWDPVEKQLLPIERRAFGVNRVAKVFRTDWEKGQALYHPYDRVAADGHSNWAGKYPMLVWSREHSIVDLLVEIHKLLNSSDYTGIRGSAG